MNTTRRITHRQHGLLLGICLLAFSAAWAAGGTAGTEAAESGKLYLPSADPVADLDAKMALARANGKRLLVVLGANWCHDSRALAARLYTAPLNALIDSGYEVLFVDVAYLETGRDVIARLGIPVYYATPTVLIVDPVSGGVVNAYDRHQWAEAASIGMAASVDYFRKFQTAGETAAGSDDDAVLQALLADIDAFELRQAERLYQAYAKLGPMLKAYKEGDKSAFREDLWNEVRDFRYQVPNDLDALRAEARERVAAGETGIVLQYPVYPAFSWEPGS
jgi:hypothetical protein